MADYDYMEAIDLMVSKARDAVIDGGLMGLDPGELIACVGMMTERLRQAEKDAARYRWPDEQNKNVMSKVMVCNGWIESIKDECDELVSEGLGHYLVSNEAGAIRALIISLRQAEKDAARYRWLRDSALRDHLHSLIMVHPVEWDMFNDEAMNGSNN